VRAGRPPGPGGSGPGRDGSPDPDPRRPRPGSPVDSITTFLDLAPVPLTLSAAGKVAAGIDED